MWQQQHLHQHPGHCGQLPRPAVPGTPAPRPNHLLVSIRISNHAVIMTPSQLRLPLWISCLESIPVRLNPSTFPIKNVHKVLLRSAEDTKLEASKVIITTVILLDGKEGLQKRHANVRKSISTFSRSIIFPFLRITVTLMFLSVSRNAYSISKPSAYDADDSDVSDVLNHDHLPGKRPLCTGCIQMRTDCAGMKKMRKGS